MVKNYNYLSIYTVYKIDTLSKIWCEYCFNMKSKYSYIIYILMCRYSLNFSEQFPKHKIHKRVYFVFITLDDNAELADY